MKDCCLSEKITYATVFLRVNQMKYDILTCIEHTTVIFFCVWRCLQSKSNLAGDGIACIRTVRHRRCRFVR